MTEEGGTIYVTYLPYLPLRERVTVGEWELIPRGDLVEADALDGHALELAKGLADLYELPPGGGGSVGAFGRRRDGRVGDEPPGLEPMTNLQRCVVSAVVDLNESPLVSEDEKDPNFGHRALTSDNATVVTPGIARDGGWTATMSGGRVRHLAGGLRVIHDEDDPLPQLKIPPPADIRVPFLNPGHLDFEYADAMWESIIQDNDDARRLARAIDWLDLAWRNASSLTDDLRVPALQAGFEVLFDPDDPDDPERIAAVRIGKSLSELLPRDNDTPTRRSWSNLKGDGETSRELTDLAWWFVRFAFLRNALMHGRAPDRDEWFHDDVHHVDLGEWWLRQAIKETVARNGHPDIRDAPFDREIARAWRAAVAKKQGEGD